MKSVFAGPVVLLLVIPITAFAQVADQAPALGSSRPSFSAGHKVPLEEISPPLGFDVVDPALRPFLIEAMGQEKAGNLLKAEAAYRLVLMRDSTIPAAVLGLARVLEVMGDSDGADRTLATLPNDADVVEARAFLLEGSDPATALLLFRRLETLELGSAAPFLHQARILAGATAMGEAGNPLAALQAYQDYLELADGIPDLEVGVTVALALKAQADNERATQLLQHLRSGWPEHPVGAEIDAILDRMAVEQEAERIAAGGAVPLSPDQRLYLDEARRLVTTGKLERARPVLLDLVGRAPRSPEAWAALGDLQEEMGAYDEAERAYLAAVILAPDEAAWHARLGTLLAAAYGGRRHREAEAELSSAIGLRPTWVRLHYSIGKIRQEEGDFDGALTAFRLFLDHESVGPEVDDAQRRLADLSRRRPTPPQMDAPITNGEISDPAWSHYRVARVYRDRGDVIAARKELDLALEQSPEFPDAFMLLAALALEEGNPREAMDAYQRCLAISPENPEVLMAMGEMARASGEVTSALSWFQRAASAGAPEGWYFQASMTMDHSGALELRKVLEARRLLDTYFSHSTGGLVHEPAMALQRQLRNRLWVYQGFSGGASLLSLCILVVWYIRRRTGAPLSRLLEVEPATYHDVARLLSAIRHEVLKHNTTLLSSVADRLREGDLDAARYAAGRLFGEKGDGGVVRQFDSYVGAMEELGERHGVRLNLAVKDPVIAPMHAAMTRLRRLAGRLRHPRPRQARRLASELGSISQALNERSYGAMGRLIRTMCVLELRPEQFESVYRRVSAEPGVADTCPELAMQAGAQAIPVRIFMADLEDIAANLFRNALRVLNEELPPHERRIGLHIVEEMDPVTGLEHVALRFLDNAPRPLTEAILRARNIERGLGLALDLLARHQGVMSVESEPGWSKAVVVRLPRADTTEGDDTSSHSYGAQ